MGKYISAFFESLFFWFPSLWQLRLCPKIYPSRLLYNNCKFFNNDITVQWEAMHLARGAVFFSCFLPFWVLSPLQAISFNHHDNLLRYTPLFTLILHLRDGISRVLSSMFKFSTFKIQVCLDFRAQVLDYCLESPLGVLGGLYFSASTTRVFL